MGMMQYENETTKEVTGRLLDRIRYSSEKRTAVVEEATDRLMEGIRRSSENRTSKYAEKVRGQIEYRRYLAMPNIKRLDGGVLEVLR